MTLDTYLNFAKNYCKFSSIKKIHSFQWFSTLFLKLYYVCKSLPIDKNQNIFLVILTPSFNMCNASFPKLFNFFLILLENDQKIL